MLGKSTLSSIQTLVSEVLIDLETSHEVFVMIFTERDKYEKMKKKIKNASRNMKPNNVNLKNNEFVVMLNIFPIYIKCI